MARALSSGVTAADDRELVVVGDGPGLERLVRHLRGQSRAIGIIADHRPAVPADWEYLGPIDRLPEVLGQERAVEVALCLNASQIEQMGSIVQACMEVGVPLWLPLADFGDAQTPHERLAGRAAKRVLDITGALAAIVLLSPVLMVTAMAIAVRDGFPVVFTQPRAGLRGRPFSIVKFRTMQKDADRLRSAMRAENEIQGGASFKMTHDPRVTALGATLRRTSIDELPQLWNVLTGTMSLVGPRPHPYDDVAGYQQWQFRRLSVKPGMTGLWQVEGRRDPDFDNWVRKDLEYIDGWSIWRDITLLARTIPAVIRGTGR